MTRYISVYRCRLCGKEYAEGGTDTGRAAMNGANEAALTASGIEPGRLCMNAPTLFSIHHCDGGSYGVSEFLGFKKADLEYKEAEEEKASSGAAIMSPEEMARYLMGLCRCRLATGNGCPGCPFDKPTSDNGDGECRLGVPEDWDF